MKRRGCLSCYCRKLNKVAPAPSPSSVNKSASSLDQKPRPSSARVLASAVINKIEHVLFGNRNIPAKIDTQLKVWVGTWNMHGELPPEDLEPFIKRPDRLDDGDVEYHLLAIGTQECERSIEKSVIYPKKEIWEQTIKDFLMPRYTMVKAEVMAAIHLCVFVLNPLVPYVSNIETGAVATGIGNVIGNKGGVAVGLKLADTSLLFITSHFTAHQSKVQERNNDFKRICREMTLKGFPKTAEDRMDVTRRYDCTFWFGDLNYRINGNRKMIDTLLSADMREVLLANDQLMIEMKKGAVFESFKEAEIKFQPTYKFDIGGKSRRKRITRRLSESSQNSDDDDDEEHERRLSVPPPLPETKEVAEESDLPPNTGRTIKRQKSVYDSSKKQRIPSWTDRVLFKSTKKPITVLDYDARMEMMHSDHKPVYGLFSIEMDWNDAEPK